MEEDTVEPQFYPEDRAADSDNTPEIETQAVSVYDPLHGYLTEIRRYPFLTKEEELRLTKQFKEAGDLDAVTKLILSHLRLAASIAMEYKRLPFNVMDLIQEGNVGLMHAVKKFDPDKGARVATYATWWIRAYILKYILQNWRLVRIGTTENQRKLFFRLSKEREALEKQGIVASPKLLADQLNVKETEVIEMTQRLSDREVSFDEPVGPDSDTSVGSLLPSENEGADESLEKEQLQTLFEAKLKAFSKEINARESEILHRRILSEKPATLEELALKYKISKERVRQVEANLLKKLKKFMQKEIPDFEDIASG